MPYIGRRNMRYAPEAVRAACLASEDGVALGHRVDGHRGGGYYERLIAKTNGLWIVAERMQDTHRENGGNDYPPSAHPLLYTSGALPEWSGPLPDPPRDHATEEAWEAHREAARVRASISCDRERMLRDPGDLVFSWETASRDCWDHLAALVWLPRSTIAPIQIMARIGGDLCDAD